MKSISNFILAATLLLIVTSCKKDSQEDLTTKGMMTSHGWIISSMTYNAEEEYLEDCQMDDCLFFKLDGTYKSSIGSLKCNPNETGDTGTWSLSEDEKSIVWTNNGSSSTWSIEVTSRSLIMTYSGLSLLVTLIPC